MCYYAARFPIWQKKEFSQWTAPLTAPNYKRAPGIKLCAVRWVFVQCVRAGAYVQFTRVWWMFSCFVLFFLRHNLPRTKWICDWHTLIMSGTAAWKARSMCCAHIRHQFPWLLLLGLSDASDALTSMLKKNYQTVQSHQCKRTRTTPFTIIL